jgi:hypothetical protein
MKKLQRRNNSNNLVVLNEKREVVDVNRSTDFNSINQERLRQSHIKFNFAITLIAMSATFCFTGVALFWSGNLSEETAITTVDLVSRLVTSYCLPLIKSSQRQLNESAAEEENDN